MVFYGVGDGGEIQVHDLQRFARRFLVIFFRRRHIHVVRADIFRHVFLHLVGEGGEAAHVRKENGDFAPRAAERQGFRAEQFVDHVRRNDFGKDRFHAALLAFLKHHAIGNEADVLNQNST